MRRSGMKQCEACEFRSTFPFQSSCSIVVFLSSFIEAYRVVREVTGYGAGRGPYLVLHGGWDQSSDLFNNSFMADADRVVLERHISFEWHDARNLSLDAQTVSSVGNMCRWGPLMNQRCETSGRFLKFPHRPIAVVHCMVSPLPASSPHPSSTAEILPGASATTPIKGNAVPGLNRTTGGQELHRPSNNS